MGKHPLYSNEVQSTSFITSSGPKIKRGAIGNRRVDFRRHRRKRKWKVAILKDPPKPKKRINPVIAGYIRRRVDDMELLSKVGKASSDPATWRLTELDPLRGTMPTSKEGLRTTLISMQKEWKDKPDNIGFLSGQVDPRWFYIQCSLDTF